MKSVLTPREERTAAIIGMQEIYAQGQHVGCAQRQAELTRLQLLLDKAEKELAKMPASSRSGV